MVTNKELKHIAMNKMKILQLLLLALFVSGCTTDDTDTRIPEEDTGKISFGRSKMWSKGAEVSGIDDVKELTLYTHFVDAKWADATSDNLSPFFTTDISTPITLTNAKSGGATSNFTYSGAAQYWPQIEGSYLNFFAYYPASELTHSLDAVSGMPTYSYSMWSLATENHDLVCDSRCDMTEGDTGGNVHFTLQHLLTNIKLEAKLSGEYDGAIYGETFAVNDIEFFGLYSDATLNTTHALTGRMFSWSVDETTSTNLYASQGYTLKAAEDCPLTTASMTSVMADGNSIFALPQAITTRTERPTMQVKILRRYDHTAPAASNVDASGRVIADYIVEGVTYEAGALAADCMSGRYTEIIYSTEEKEVPVPASNTDWVKGQEILYSFAFDLSNLDEYETPMTIMSVVLNWTDADVDVEIRPNVYVYSSLHDIKMQTNDVTGESFGEFQVCTNYHYNLLVPHGLVEPDGEIVSSRGFIFCSTSFNDPAFDNDNSVGTIVGHEEYKMYIPTLLDGEGGSEIVYVTLSNLAKYGYTLVDNGHGAGSISKGGVSTEVNFDDHGYISVYDSGINTHKLLYYKAGVATPFKYERCSEVGHDHYVIDLSEFASDDERTVYFEIKITDTYMFDFKVTKSTRGEEGLYIDGSVGGSSDCVGKKADDPVYLLHLTVDKSHLVAAGGEFHGVIKVEMVSDGGGLLKQLLPVVMTL